MVRTIGIIGAGHIGSQIARLAVASGYQAVISNSRGPETLAELVNELGPNARAATPAEAARAGDVVVVTIPLKNYRSVPVEPTAGKIVIDTNNYYPQRDGHIPELDNESTTTAELLQAHLPASFGLREWAEAGGLMSYGPNLISMRRRAADYVDKILRGAKPEDLPIEQPTEFELVINMRTAQALGLNVPRALLVRADEVIE